VEAHARDMAAMDEIEFIPLERRSPEKSEILKSCVKKNGRALRINIYGVTKSNEF